MQEAPSIVVVCFKGVLQVRGLKEVLVFTTLGQNYLSV